MNGAFGAHAGGRAKRRVVPCPTTAAGIGAGVGAGPGAAGAAADVCRRVTGMAAPWIGVVCDGFATCAGALVLSGLVPLEAAASSARRYPGWPPRAIATHQICPPLTMLGEADVVADESRSTHANESWAKHQVRVGEERPPAG